MTPSRRLLLSPAAVTDLDEIADYIARDNPARAAGFIRELEARCLAIARTPDIHPLRSDLAAALRMAVHGRYLVLYRDLADQGVVRIERIVHGARNLPPLI